MRIESLDINSIDLDGYDVVMVEGYEMVGKTTLVNKLSKEYNIAPLIVDYNLFNRDVIHPNDRYILGLSSISTMMSHPRYRFHKYKDKKEFILMDRSLPSNLVYNEIYKDEKSYDRIELITESYIKLLKGKKILILHLQHTDKDIFELYYNNSKDRPTNDDYDKFIGVDESWIDYKKCNELFLSLYNSTLFYHIIQELECKVYKVNTSDIVTLDILQPYLNEHNVILSNNDLHNLRIKDIDKIRIAVGRNIYVVCIGKSDKNICKEYTTSIYTYDDCISDRDNPLVSINTNSKISAITESVKYLCKYCNIW